MSAYSEAVMAVADIVDWVQGQLDIVDQDWLPDVNDYLNGMGYSFLGAGHFSAAWYHAVSAKVLKIGFKQAIDSGLGYAQWARANQAMVGVPAVHELGSVGAFWYMVTGKYEAYPSHLLGPEYRQRLSSAMSYYLCYTDDTAPEVQEYIHAMPALFETLAAIHVYFKGTANFDLHKDNILWDGNKPIINDPTSFSAYSSRYFCEDSTDATN